MPPNVISVDDFSSQAPALVGSSTSVFGSDDPDSLVVVGIWSDATWEAPSGAGWIGPFSVQGTDQIEFPGFKLMVFYLRSPGEDFHNFTTEDAADHIHVVQRCVVHCDGPTSSVLVDWDTALVDGKFVDGSRGSFTTSPTTDDTATGWAAAVGPDGHDSVALFFSALAVNVSASSYTGPTVDVDAGPSNPVHSVDDPPGTENPATGFNATVPAGAYTSLIGSYLSYVLLSDGAGITADDYRTDWAFGSTEPREHISLLAVLQLADEGAEPEPGTPIVSIRCGVNELDLGPDFAAYGDEGEWSSVANGGYDSMTLRIPGQVYRDNVDALGWGAEVAVFLPSDDPYDPGVQVWAGTLIEPATEPDGDYVTLEATGWATLLHERDDPLLWSTYGVADVRPAEGEPWTYENDDSIRVTVEATQVIFSVEKGDDVGAGDIARAGMWAEDHVIREIAGTLRSNIASANYEPTIWTQSSPEAPGTAVEDHSFTDVDSGATPFDVTLDDPQGAAFFQLERTDGGTSDAARLRFRIDDLRFRDLADSDTYSVAAVMTDVCELAGLDPFSIGATATPAMPLWHTSGSWADLIDYVALSRGWPWGVWEKSETGPKFIYRAFDNAPLWRVRAYGSDAECVMTPTRTQDVYTHVDVSFRMVGEHRTRHRRATVDLEEVAPCADGRVRVFRLDLRDPQPDFTAAERIRDDLATELATQDFGVEFELGPIRDDDEVVHNPALVKATERILVEDFPNPDGTFGRTFRIYAARYDQMNGSAQVSAGRVPGHLARFLYWQEQKARRLGLA